MAQTPFYLDDLNGLREKLARAERDDSTLGRVWSAVRRRAHSAPESFPWFTPFVALVTGAERDAEPARRMILSYLQTLDVQPFGSGLQFHFWCFSFPHARWGLYFQWLHAAGLWDEDEAKAVGERFITEQFVNFFFGMRTKPEPECVDNQSMSLCFSNALLGHLFGAEPYNSLTARRMRADGARRLPGMIGGMPVSGYSGEGSTYMDDVVGPAIPFLVEFLERTQGGDWFNRPLEPNGASAAGISRMIAREWMPGGILLPWDHYGYQLHMRSCLSYAARREGGVYRELLENHASWSHDGSIGWGFDDLIWSLVWWPEDKYTPAGQVFTSWAEPNVGAALISENADLYLMQMWDHTRPVVPSREHCNPNSIILSAYDVPLSVDGIPTEECTAFNYEDTWKEVSYMDLNSRKFNYGNGCGGAHSILLVDGWEGMRAQTFYPQSEMLSFDAEAAEVTADVTPLYAERWPDAIQVARRSRLCENRFWLIEDFAQFTEEHQVTSRWWLRPDHREADHGIALETAEGVSLRLLPLIGPDEKSVTLVDGYPRQLDGRSLRADWTQSGKDIRWLWLAWPDNARQEVQDVSTEWTAIADATSAFGYEQAVVALQTSPLNIPFTAPADTLADALPCARWWYRKTVTVPEATQWWLRLPRQMFEPRLWVDGAEISLAAHENCMNLLEPHVEMPGNLQPATEIEIVVRCNVGISQYGVGGHEGTGFSGRPAILVGQLLPELEATFANGLVTIQSGGKTWQANHDLLTFQKELAK